MKISIIAAMDEKRGIGKDNKIPWHIKEDFKRFRTLTSGHPIVMGRKTWDSLPFKPLPNRLNIVVSRKAGKLAQGASVVISLDDALTLAKQYESDKSKQDTTHIQEVFIIGGGQIFEQALPFADKLYLTIVESPSADGFGADTFFPDYSDFKKVVFERKGESEGLKYTFLELER